MNEAIMELDRLLAYYDASLRFEVSSGCAWSAEVRLTLTDPEGAPSRSITFYKAGGADPNDLAEELYADVLEWLETSGQKPMPVPEWLS